MSEKDGGPAFPRLALKVTLPDGSVVPNDPGMTLRDWFAGKALSNPAICSGEAKEWELTAWFGKNTVGITRQQIVAKQAASYADAMLKERDK